MIRTIFIGLVRAYQILISPLSPPSCIYSPVCSSYAINAINKHGAFKGIFLFFLRFFRCFGLLYRGGYDPVPEDFSVKQGLKSYTYFWRWKKKKKETKLPLDQD